METPTFLTQEKQKARNKPGGEKKEEPPVPRPQNPEPERTTKPLARASVKEKIEKINRKTANSPGKLPEIKQAKMMVNLRRNLQRP